MPRVTRTDRIRVDLESSEVVIHPEGWVDAPGDATRIGVLDYGDHRELRPAEAVFDAESLASLAGAPITIDHPAGFVTSANARDLTHGTVLEVMPRREDGWVSVRVRLLTDEAIEAARAGKGALSCGYEADVEPAEGEFEGETYQAVQTRIRYNHLALVDAGRAGPLARLRLDGQDPDGMAQAIKITPRNRWILDAARRVRFRADAVQVGTATFQIEGEDPVELTLPASMIRSMLAAVGAEDTPAAEAAEPVALEGEDMVEDEDKPSDPTGESAAPPSEERMDRAEVESRIAAAVRAERERGALARRISRVTADPRLDTADVVDLIAIGLEAVGSKAPDRDLESARRGDARTLGRLEARLDLALAAGPAARHDSGAGLIGALTGPRADRVDAAPTTEYLRTLRLAGLSGGKAS